MLPSCVWAVVVTTVTAVTTLTLYLTLVLVVPSKLDRTISTVFIVGMRTRRLSVASKASNTSFPLSSSAVIAELAEFRVQTAVRVDK